MANYGGGGAAGGGRNWGRWSSVSTTAREIDEFGYQVVIHDQDIAYLLHRDPTAKFVVEGIAGDTWREWFKTDNDLLNRVCKELMPKGLLEQFLSADVSNRAFGLGLVMLGFKDGCNVDEPLKPRAQWGKEQAFGVEHIEGYSAAVPGQFLDEPQSGFEEQEDLSDLDEEFKDLSGAEVDDAFKTAASGLLPRDHDPAHLDEAFEELDNETGDIDQQFKHEAARVGTGQVGPDGKPSDDDIRIRASEIADLIDFIEVYSYEEIVDYDFDQDETSSTFGEVTRYLVQVEAGESLYQKWVHASRCIRFKEDRSTRAPVGSRVLEPVFDQIQLLRQMEWAAAEGFYQRVVPPFIVEVNEDFSFGPEHQKQLEDQFNGFRTGVKQFLGVEGVKITPMAGGGETQDPENTFRMLVSRIAAGTGVPPRKLIMAAKGAVSESQEDRKEYESWISKRQRTYAGAVARRFFELLVDADLLTEEDLGDYELRWNPITPMSKQEETQVEGALTTARQAYLQAGIPWPALMDYEPTTNPEMLAIIQKVQQQAQQAQMQKAAAGAPPGAGGPPGAGAPPPPGGPAGAQPEAPADAPPTPEEAQHDQEALDRFRMSGNAVIDPKTQGRIDNWDDSVKRRMKAHESKVEAFLHEAADAITSSLISKVPDVRGKHYGPADILDLDVDPKVTKSLVKRLQAILEDIMQRSADDLQEAFVKDRRVTMNNWAANADDAFTLDVKRVLATIASTTADRLVRDAVTNARQGAANAIAKSEDPNVFKGYVQATLDRFFVKNIPAITTIASTTAMNQGRHSFIMRNQGLIPRVMFRNPLDASTTDICEDRATYHGAQEGLIVDVASPAYFANLPPLHFNCRSWYSPVPADYPRVSDTMKDIVGLTPKSAGF